MSVTLIRLLTAVVELIWVDLVLRNPLDAELNLTEISLLVHEKSGAELTSTNAFVEVQTIDEIILGPRESRTVGFLQLFPVGVTSDF